MKLFTVLCLILPLWLLDCATTAQKKSIDQRSLWKPIIAYLHQSGSIKDYDFDDLSDLYASEISDLEAKAMKAHVTENQFVFEEIEKLNQHEIEKLDHKLTIDYKDIAKNVLKAVESHPIAKSSMAAAYDQTGQVGFCFGRALLIHYYLLKAGVLPKDIFKVFALGDLFLGGTYWQFHVAVMIKSAGEFLVVDPLYGEIAQVNDWMANVKSLEIKHPLSRARFYVTAPQKFIPKSGPYAPEAFDRAELSAYFFDLVKSL